MERQCALELLGRSKSELQTRLGVAQLALFGSTARDSAGSDVDILAAFDGPATSKRYFGVQFRLEDPLGCPEIPWRMIIATRNRLIHAIDDDSPWRIVRDDMHEPLPPLKAFKSEAQA